MDFDLSEEQLAIAELAGQILTDKLPPERLREIENEQPDRWLVDDVWHELAKADLLGICLPEAVGGGGYGFFEACLLLEAVGRAAAPLPALATLVLGALPIAEFGTAGQQRALLPGVIDGSTILSAALQEDGDYSTPGVPATTARAEGDGWVLDGEKTYVAAAHLAARILVPARTGDSSTTVFLIDPNATGVTREVSTAITGEPLWTVRLSGVQVARDDVLGEVDGGAAIVRWTTDRAIAALCSTQVGVCDGALKLTAAYVSEREQFGSKIGTFQAVAQRIADAYIDTEAIRLTALQAAWRLSEGLEAEDELHIAKYWAADGGHRVVHAAQHLHGGIGLDIDYPVHRYFRWTKAMELSLGHATTHLRGLGQRIAVAPT
ncbi:MAG: 3-oxocholest-4-en-26-oyl-CoA dehydrogenase beta subunit [Acidimicrobiaceae bacterium]